MKKILVVFILGIITLNCGCGPLRTENVKINYNNGTSDTIFLRYRGKLHISSNELFDNTEGLGIYNVKSFSILK